MHTPDCITASEHFCAKPVFILAAAHSTSEFKLVRIINKNFFFKADQPASVENSYCLILNAIEKLNSFSFIFYKVRGFPQTQQTLPVYWLCIQSGLHPRPTACPYVSLSLPIFKTLNKVKSTHSLCISIYKMQHKSHYAYSGEKERDTAMLWEPLTEHIAIFSLSSHEMRI